MNRKRTFREALNASLAAAFVCLFVGVLQAAPPPFGADPAPPSTSPYAPSAPAVSSSVTSGEITDAGEFGDAMLSGEPQLNVTAGGEKGLGVATVAGQSIDVNRLVPTTADPSYVTRLQAANNGKDLLGLKAMYDAEAVSDQTKTGIETKAATTVNNSAADRLYTTQNLANDPTMNSSAAIINQSKGGTILGEVFAACSSESVPDNSNTTQTLHEEKMCDKVLIPGDGGPACSRTRTGTAKYSVEEASKDAKLLVNREVTGQQCTRTTTAQKLPTALDMAVDRDLPITTETGGLSCTRQISANVNGVDSPGSAQGDLPVDKQVGGHSCTRSVTVAKGTPTSLGTFKVNFSVHGGPLCSTDETDVPIASVLPPGTTSVGNITLVATQNNGYGYPPIHQYPTAANGWVAIFGSVCIGGGGPGGPGGGGGLPGHGSVLPTPSGTGVTDPGQLVNVAFMGWIGFMQFTAFGGSTVDTVGVSDSGSCGDAGTPDCPAKWTCATNAPTSFAGVPVSVANAQSIAPLFPGAGSSCAVGSLDRTCGGSATTNSTISILSYLPPGIAHVDGRNEDPVLMRLADWILPTAVAAPAPGSSFSNFQWTVTNPQPGITVSLTQVPSASNGWKAGFSVTRTDFSYVPQQPHISMSWTVTTSTGQFGTGDQGNCMDTGSTACPTRWTCTNNAPTTIGGYPITVADASALAPLFPGANASCVAGKLSRVCDGASALGSTIGIGNLLPAGTTAISNFAWTVTNPDARITVALLAPPTDANGWTASFNVTRQYGGAVPPLPHVHLTWTVDGPEQIVISHVDTGNCSATSPEASCTMAWTCTGSAPLVINGITVNAPDPSPLYPGAAPTCLNARLDETCSGNGAKQTSVSIASEIYPGDTAITDYAWTVTTAVPGVTVKEIQVPALSNNWVAIFETTRGDWSHAPADGPDIHLSWKMNGAPVYTFNIVDTGDCSAQSTNFCSVTWSCDGSAPVTIDGINVPVSVINGEPALFSGDGGACMKATLHYNCSGVWSGDGGQVCWTNDAGNQQCTEVPPSGTPPDSCNDLQNDTSCVLKTSDCADGAMDASGFCFVRTYVYDCITPVTVPTGNTTEVTTCTGAQPCLDGSCNAPSKPEGPNGRNESMAKQLMVQTVQNDWEWTGPKALAPGMPDPGQGTSSQTQ